MNYGEEGGGLIMMNVVQYEMMISWCIASCYSSGYGLPWLVVLQLLLTICDEPVGWCWEMLVFTCKNVRRFSTVVRVYVLWMEGFYSGHREGEGGGCGTFCHPTLSIHMVTVSWFHSDCGGAIVWGCVRMRGWIIPSVEGHLQSLDVTMRHTMDPHEHGLCD